MKLNEIKAFAALAPPKYQKLVVELAQYVQLSPKYKNYEISHLELDTSRDDCSFLRVSMKHKTNPYELAPSIDFILERELK